jgi:hypothetical protein
VRSVRQGAELNAGSSGGPVVDKRTFNFVIMGLYLCTAVWWGFHRKWADMFYWLSALSITATVTFGYEH